MKTNLRISYIVALCVLIALSVTTFNVLMSTNDVIVTDGSSINLAGRQRMLSQRIASKSQALSSALQEGDQKQANRVSSELAGAMETWKTSHDQLLAIQSRVEDNPTSVVEISYNLKQLSSSIDAVDYLVKQLHLASNSRTPVYTQEEAGELSRQIWEHTEAFLPVMHETVGLYELQLVKHISQTEQSATRTFAASLLVIFAVGLFLFEPALQRIRRQHQEIMEMQEAFDNKVHEASKTSAELQSVLAAASRVSIIATNQYGLVTTFNSGAEQMLGYTADEVIGQMTPQAFHLESEVKDRGAELSREYGEKIEGFDVFVYKTRQGSHEDRLWTYVRKDGVQLNVRLSVTAMRDEHNLLTGYLGVAIDLSDQLHAEQKLEEKTDELQGIIDAIPGFVFYKNKSNLILDCNKAAAESIGVPRARIRNRQTEEFFPPADSASYLEDDVAVINSGKPKIGIVETYETGGNDIKYIRTDKIPIRNDDGEFDRLVAIASDVTEQKKTEDALKNSELRFALAADGASVGIWDWIDVDGEEEWWSPQFYKMLGYEDQEIPATLKNFSDLIHPDQKNATFEAVEAHLRQKKPFRIEYQLKHKTAGYRWYLGTGQAVWDKDGVPLRMIGSIMDINDYRNVVSLIEASNEELSATQKRYELALQGSQDAIFDWHIEEASTYYSPQWRVLLDDPDMNLQTKKATLIDHVASHDLNRVKREITRFILSGAANFESKFQVMAKNGKGVWVLMRAAAIRNDEGVATRLSGSLADISSLKQAEEELTRLVQQDHLTGLASRSKLMADLKKGLSRSRRTGKVCAVLFFDFDRFKVVNDSLGHDVGDELLCSIAGRLEGNIRETDSAARFGGDEFVVLLEDLANSDEASMVAEKLLNVCAESHSIRGHSLVSTASIGLVTNESTPGDGNELLRFADAAMYEAKRRGRGCVVEFDKEMFEEELEKLSLEEDLNSAHFDDQLSLNYQPIVCLQTGETVAAEALMRWTHPKKGPIPPDIFIPIAEESNQIVTMGESAVTEACKQLADWRRRGIVPETFAISVNVAKSQLLTPGFAEFLTSQIDAYKLNRNSIKVEVTETTVVDNRADVSTVLDELREQGIIVMMDDFGTGHSSLSGLHSLPVDELKIDQSFIRNADGNRDLIAITSSIVTLADHLSLRTIGEGIESPAHIALLQAMGCEYGQGYFWCRPLPPDEFEQDFLDKHSVTAESA